MKFEIQVQSTRKTEFVDITPQLQHCVSQSGVQDGICVVSVPHTTAGLTVNENWDPSVQADILALLDRLVPASANYEHTEGNAAAHIKSCLIGVSQALHVEGGKLLLGAWQGVFLTEFDGPRPRRVLVRVLTEVEG